jgi:hypothetical protein
MQQLTGEGEISKMPPFVEARSGKRCRERKVAVI